MHASLMTRELRIILHTMRQVGNVRSDALFILLVEKDAAFMRLAEDRFYNTYPCIIITAKGQPDVASRSRPHTFRLWSLDRHHHMGVLAVWFKHGLLQICI